MNYDPRHGDTVRALFANFDQRTFGRPPTLDPILDPRYPHPGALITMPQFPGDGYPPRPGEGPRHRQTAWARLCEGGAIGKKTILLYNSDEDAKQPAPVPMLSIEGDDADACQMIITLSPPSVIPLAFAHVSGSFANQNTTGEQDNQQIRTRDPFPGEAGPIVWPSIHAIVEFGTGGTSSRVAVDFVNGARFTVSASFVRVFASIAATTRSGLIGTSAAYVLGAFASPGFGNIGAQRTIYVNELDEDAESQVFSVPKFAKRAYLIGCDGGAAPNLTIGVIRFWQSSDGLAGGNNVGNQFVSGNQPAAFDVPAAAAYFSVLSGMPGPTLFSVVFELSF